MPDKKEELTGVLDFFTETGTEGGYWAFQDSRYISHGQWSYEGLYILKDGDYLTIYSKDNPQEVVWKGEISLQQYPAFTEEIFGFWIHADQKGIDRGTWARCFINNFPAKLIPSQKNHKQKGMQEMRSKAKSAKASGDGGKKNKKGQDPTTTGVDDLVAMEIERLEKKMEESKMKQKKEFELCDEKWTKDFVKFIETHEPSEFTKHLDDCSVCQAATEKVIKKQGEAIHRGMEELCRREKKEKKQGKTGDILMIISLIGFVCGFGLVILESFLFNMGTSVIGIVIVALSLISMLLVANFTKSPKTKERKKVIIKNAAKCKLCGDVIESTYNHDNVKCKCGEISIDGGKERIRQSANNMDNLIDLSEVKKTNN